MNKIIPLIIIAISALAGGCAYVNYEKVNSTYTIRYKHGIDYYNTSLRSGFLGFKTIWPYYGPGLARLPGGESYVLLDGGKTIIFSGYVYYKDGGFTHVFVSKGGGRAYDLTKDIFNWGKQQGDFDSDTLYIDYGTMSLDGETLRLSIACSYAYDKIKRRETDIPISKVREFIDNALRGQPASPEVDKNCNEWREE